ncbi:Xaa-Pro aminopeptidase [Hydrogenispora ethanolica]|uniref:Xaa-Pro aminopeptidase n=1 Tax=Hydrogenispora ethanolica TaxID=1082276 RepID=A0A4R1RVP6_HYDET|nr:Xaa-Pro peptidase family protein [Hydrogenispora ethanolica]TCL70728.1 Xaa-Pro aminopeptidase [Hydrogenispora ethanolica]
MAFAILEYQDRLKRLRQALAEQGADLALLSQNSDIYYYSGSVAPLYLAVPALAEPFLLARKAEQRIREEAAHLPLELFQSTKDLKAILERRGLGRTRRIGFTLDTISYASVSRWLALFEAAEPVDLSWEIRAARWVKSKAEIAVLARAGAIMAELPEWVRASFRPGISELELSAMLEGSMRSRGHAGLVRCRREGIEMGMGVCSAGASALAGTKFDGVCAGAGTAPAVPYGACGKRIQPGEPVVLDYAFNLEGYHIDQTRLCCWGEPPAAVREAYAAMLQVEQRALATMRPGAGWGEVYDAACRLAAELGYEREFMGLGAEKVRFVGHGIGLELDEPPFLALKQERRLEAGMVAAVEPKVSLPGVGVIGIEDTVVVRENGVELLTTCAPEMIIIPHP